MHTTNYFDTFIKVAEDCPADEGIIPPLRGTKKSIANLQYEMVSQNPYRYTSDEVFFAVLAKRKDFAESELKIEREKFFSKGQPCFRASPLSKRYGWGVHSNSEGKVAIYGMESEEYEQFSNNEALKHTKAMRSKRV